MLIMIALHICLNPRGDSLLPKAIQLNSYVYGHVYGQITRIKADPFLSLFIKCRNLGFKLRKILGIFFSSKCYLLAILLATCSCSKGANCPVVVKCSCNAPNQFRILETQSPYVFLTNTNSQCRTRFS